MDAQIINPQSTEADSDNYDRPAASLGVVPGVVWAFRFKDDGTAIALPADQPIENRHDSWVWLHLDLANARVLEWLRGTDLPTTAVTMMASRDRHQQMHSTKSCIYGVFADLVRGVDGATDEIGHLRFIMTERLLVSGRHHALASVESARSTIEGGARRLPHVASLLELIVEHAAEGADQAIEHMETVLDQVEDCLARGSGEVERNELTAVRRSSVRLHRQLSGLRTVFHRLEQDDDVSPQLRLTTGKLLQRLDSIDHNIVELRERGHQLQEELSSLMTQNTNRYLYILSILTTLLLPPTLVTGVFGMNTKGLPFTDMDEAFLYAMALVVGSSILVYLVMRTIGVFKL